MDSRALLPLLMLVALGALALPGATVATPAAPPTCADGPLPPGAFSRSPGGTPEVEAGWLLAHRCQVRVVDVREPEEMARDGAMEGAENVPLQAIANAADAWDKEAPIVLVCRSGRRASAAQEILAAGGFRHVASLTGGMLAWTHEGHRVVHPEPPAAPAAAVEQHLRRPGAVVWTTAARLFASGAAACVDGRSDVPVIGTPGGDVGDLLLALAAFEAAAGAQTTPERLDALIPAYVASFGRFYLHTDTHALLHLRDALREQPGFAFLADATPEAMRHLMLAPPADLESPLLDALTLPENIGCGHLRQQLSDPAAYGVRPHLPRDLLRAVFRHAFRHPESLDFVVLEGEHEERGVLLVRQDAPVEAHSRVPMLAPHDALAGQFIFHPDVASFLRNETADFLAEHHRLLGLQAPDRPALHDAVDRLGERQLDETLRRLAPGLPRAEVYLVEEP